MPHTAEIYFHAYGEEDEPAVVLLHGAGGDYLYWPPAVRRMTGLRVYALDLPGHGKSEGPGYQSISAYAQAVLRWLDMLKLAKVAVIGHSMGGAVAMALYFQASERVQALGLISTAARLPVNPTLLADTCAETTLERAIENIIAWSYSSDAEPEIKALALRRMRALRASVLHNDFVACDAFGASERLNEITKPTLVVCGSEDRMTPVRTSQFLADQIPNARLVLIPGAGHMVMQEQPEPVAVALAGFLRSLPE